MELWALFLLPTVGLVAAVGLMNVVTSGFAASPSVLRILKWVIVVIALAGAAVLAFAVGQGPWILLILAPFAALALLWVWSEMRAEREARRSGEISRGEATFIRPEERRQHWWGGWGNWGP